LLDQEPCGKNDKKNPCKNGATCSWETCNSVACYKSGIHSYYKCSCKEGFTGENCEKKLENCFNDRKASLIQFGISKDIVPNVVIKHNMTCSTSGGASWKQSTQMSTQKSGKKLRKFHKIFT
jgi:hypothetical protein